MSLFFCFVKNNSTKNNVQKIIITRNNSNINLEVATLKIITRCFINSIKIYNIIQFYFFKSSINIIKINVTENRIMNTDQLVCNI